MGLPLDLPGELEKDAQKIIFPSRGGHGGQGGWTEFRRDAKTKH
jgi:hypothetical protein